MIRAKERRTSKRNRTHSKADALAGPRAVSATARDEMRKVAEQQIDEFIKKIGDSNPLQRTDEEGWRWFEYRTVRGRAGIVQSDTDGEIYLRVESMVVELLPDEEIDVRLMRELLQTNMTIPGAARLGLGNEGIFAVATIPVFELKPGDVSTHIRSVMAVAASYANPPREQVTPERKSQEHTALEEIPEPSPQAA
jgi:hypothetical protein